MQLAAPHLFGLCSEPRIFALLFIRPPAKRETGQMKGMDNGSKKIAACKQGIVFTPYRKRGECGCRLRRSAAALVTKSFSQELTIKMSQTEDNTQLTYMSSS